jgi:transcription elongation factor GreA
MANQMTKESYKKLEEKLNYLKTVRRKEISRVVGEAREHGDLRENSAYHAAKDEQGLNEMKIRDLEAQLASATIVKESDLPQSDTVRLGSTVTIQDLASERQFSYTIVPEIEADIFENKISTASPVGEALINQKIGEVVEVEAPAGLIKYKILAIK